MVITPVRVIFWVIHQPSAGRMIAIGIRMNKNYGPKYQYTFFYKLNFRYVAHISNEKTEPKFKMLF